MDLPVLTTHNFELAADAVLVVESARLNVASDHQVERRVGRLVWVIYVHIVAADSELVVGWVHPTSEKLFIQNFTSKIDLLTLLRHAISRIGHISAGCVVCKEWIGVLSNWIDPTLVSTVNALTVLVGILIVEVKIVFAIGVPVLHIWRT